MNSPLKILLYQPREAWLPRRPGFVGRLQLTPPLALANLAALIPAELSVQVEVCDERLTHSGRYDLRYDIVAFHFAAAAAPRAYQLAAHYRQMGAHVVFLGEHMLYQANEGLEQADTVIQGAPELAWPAFLMQYADHQPKRRYEMNDLEPADLTAPDRGVFPKYGYAQIPAIQINPNCWQDLSGQPLRPEWQGEPRPIDDVLAELEALASPHYLFVDPDFFGERDYAIALMMALRRLQIRWQGRARLPLIWDKELVYWARESGCCGLNLALEALPPGGPALADPHQFRQAIARLQAAGIAVSGRYLLGQDGVPAESWQTLAEQVAYLELDWARFRIHTPAPGSPVHQQLAEEERLLSLDWADYTGRKVVVRPQNCSPEQLAELYYLACERTYRWPNIRKRLNRAQAEQKFSLFLTNFGLKFQDWES